MNDKELQKIIDTKNSTISVLKDTVKKWVHEYNMLDACIELQNEKLNAYKMSENEANEIIAELKAENECLKQEFEIESLTDKTTGETIYRSNLVNKYKSCLQEIKAIAETPKPFIDFSETKTAIEVEYDYAAICNELELRLHRVLDLITKAEEE